MKKTKKLFGNLNRDHRRRSKVPLLVIALIAVIGFMPVVLSLTACDDGGSGGDSNGGLTITNIPAQYNGKYVWGSGMTELGYLVTADSINNSSLSAGRISNGSVTLKVWEISDDNTPVSFNGSGRVSLWIAIFDSAAEQEENMAIDSAYVEIAFTNGKGTGKYVDEGSSGDGGEGLLGKWYGSSGDETLEFQPDGKLIIDIASANFTVSYRVSGNTFDIVEYGEVTSTSTFGISVSGSVFTLTVSNSGSNYRFLDGVYTRTGGNSGGGKTLSQWLDGLETTAESNGNYEYTITANEALAPQRLSYEDEDYTPKSNITITLKADSPVTVSRLGGSSRLFTVYGGITLVLGDNITLSGGGVDVRSNGTFTMNGGEISGSTNTSNGGGVYVDGGTFTMNGGKISSNTAHGGGGVYVGYNGTFTMNGGEISGNTVTASDFDASGTYGGGVRVYAGGTFTMDGGKISGNTATSRDSNNYGGGVSVDGGTFIMKSGEISGNAAKGSGGYGGGVHMNGGTFRIVTGTIYGTDEANAALKNTADKDGAALYKLGVSATAEYGTFSGSTWNSNGTLSSAGNTIKVVNGALQP
jgi:hypothetical protein